MAVKIIIDSASDITAAEAEVMGIEMMPMSIQFGETEYQAGVNLSACEFYEKLAGAKELPKTSMINSYRFEEAFQRATKTGMKCLQSCFRPNFRVLMKRRSKRRQALTVRCSWWIL